MALVPPFAPGKAFTVTATVTDPLPDQTLTLVLPADLRLVEGTAVTTVPRPVGPTSQVAWKVMVDKPGTFPIRVQSSSGLILKKTIKIEPRDEAGGGTFVLKHSGEIAPGKEFTLRAEVTSPVPGRN